MTNDIVIVRLKQEKSNLLRKAKKASTEELVVINQQLKEINTQLEALQKGDDAESESTQQAFENVEKVLADPSHQRLTFVKTDGKFWMYLPHHQDWRGIAKDSFRLGNPALRTEKAWALFMRVMEETGRIVVDKTASYRSLPPGEFLNLIVTEHWLKPGPQTENTRFFEHLLYAIGSGKPENILHLKQVIGWKYLHPADSWRLPCLCMYGRGGAGKNLLGKTIPSIIFGPSQCLVAKTRTLERFNDKIAGKATVLFDEQPNKDAQEDIKALIGQPTVTLEPKGSSIFEADNTPLYFIASNDDVGPIRIENNGSERRFSMIHSNMDLIEVIATKEGLTFAEAQALIDNFLDREVFRNPIEVAGFLTMCVEEAKLLARPPKALHGEDFQELQSIQKDSTEEVLEEIFIDYKNFDYIALQTLYNIYKLRCAQLNPGSSPMAVQRFSGRVKSFIEKKEHRGRFARCKERINLRMPGNMPPLKAYVYFSTDKFPRGVDEAQLSNNCDLYLSGRHLAETPRQDKMAALNFAFNQQNEGAH